MKDKFIIVKFTVARVEGRHDELYVLVKYKDGMEAWVTITRDALADLNTQIAHLDTEAK